MCEHTIPPREFQRRVEAVAPDGIPTAQWFADAAGRTYGWAYKKFTGENRISKADVRLLELIEGSHLVARNRGPIEQRMASLRDRVRTMRVQLRDDAASALRVAEELEETLSRALGGVP